MESIQQQKTSVIIKPRSKQYIIYLVLFMGIVAIMDQYLSMVPITYMNSILDEYAITASQFSWWEALYLIPTFFIFALNGLVDIIGRKFSILLLILIMGFSSLAIVFLTPTFHFFMIFYSIVTFTTVSNMWAIPISEESPAQKRAKLSSIVYVIGLFPLSAIIPLYVIPTTDGSNILVNFSRDLDGPDRIILLRFRNPEEGHDGITDILLDETFIV